MLAYFLSYWNEYCSRDITNIFHPYQIILFYLKKFDPRTQPTDEVRPDLFTREVLKVFLLLIKRVTFAFNTKEIAHMEGWVLLLLKSCIASLICDSNRATQETLLIECQTCLKLRLGWGKNKVLAQGLNTLSICSYQIVLLFAPSNLGLTLPFFFISMNNLTVCSPATSPRLMLQIPTFPPTDPR